MHVSKSDNARKTTIGTPPQKTSVIVDTGSHHTAFPCSGCKSCGKHTDPYFDPDKSSTLRRLGCSDCVAAARCVTKTCQVSQSYTEGSSWKAVQMKDAYYVGGTSLTEKASRDGSAWALGASWMSLVKCVVLPKGPETERSSVRGNWLSPLDTESA